MSPSFGCSWKGPPYERWFQDEYWLADFERRLRDGYLLTGEEILGLIPKLRRVRLEHTELRTALESRQIHPVSSRICHAPINGSMW